MVTLLIAFCVTVIAAVVLGIAVGRLTPIVAGMSLLCGLGGGVYAWSRVPRSTQQGGKPTPIDWFVIGCFGIFALRAFGWVVFVDGDSLSILSESNYSDLPLHLTFINYFARGARFWPESPIYSGAKLHYPFGADLFNALLSLLGLGDVVGLVAVGLMASLITCVALYQWGRGFAIAGFLFSGGLAGLSFFTGWWDALRAFLATGHFHFALSDYQAEVAWKNIALAMFVPQRGLLYAIPAGVVLLTSWRRRWSGRPSAPDLLPLPIEALLFSAIPLFSVHAFIWLSAVLGCWLVIGLPTIRIHVVKLLAASFVPASVFVALVTGLFDRHGPVAQSVHFKAGWLQEDDGWFEFWIGNFGILPVCVLALVVLSFWRFDLKVAPRASGRHGLSRISMRFTRRDWHDNGVRCRIGFVLPSVLLFLVACFVMFAAWEWDNTKIMFWSYLCLLPFISETIVRPLPRFASAPLCAVLFFSGFLSLWGGIDWTHTGWPIADRDELQEVRKVTANLPVDESFAAYPTYDHPLLLSGCKLVEGFEGHLRSHGIEYTERLHHLQSLMLGGSDWLEVARTLHVRYLFWGEREQEHYPQSLKPWRGQCPIVAQGDWGEIYDLSTRREASLKL